MTAPQTAGPALREARKTAKLSQGALAEAIGVVQPMISLWESDERRPTLSDALALQGAIGLDARVWGYTDGEIARVAAAFVEASPSPCTPPTDATATALDGTPSLAAAEHKREPATRTRSASTSRRRSAVDPRAA